MHGKKDFVFSCRVVQTIWKAELFSLNICCYFFPCSHSIFNSYILYGKLCDLKNIDILGRMFETNNKKNYQEFIWGVSGMGSDEFKFRKSADVFLLN